jgi:predicted permease
MENLVLSVNVVAPLFLCMMLGYGLKRFNIVDAAFIGKLNSVVFKVFLPTLLFYNIYKTSHENIIDFWLIGYALLCVLGIFFILCLIIPKIEKDDRRRSVMIQGIFRSNFIIFGVPVVTGIMGEAGVVETAFLFAIVVPVYNALAVIILEVYSGRRSSPKKILMGIIKNPLIVSSLIGVAFFAAGIKLPEFLSSTVEDISQLATPLALIALGGSFRFASTRGYLKQLSIVVAARLVLIPAVFVTLSALLDFRLAPLAALLAMFGAPTAVSSFTMAEQMGADSDLAGQIVVYTSLFSILTMFVWIFLLKQLAFI